MAFRYSFVGRTAILAGAATSGATEKSGRRNAPGQETCCTSLWSKESSKNPGLFKGGGYEYGSPSSPISFTQSVGSRLSSTEKTVGGYKKGHPASFKMRNSSASMPMNDYSWTEAGRRFELARAREPASPQVRGSRRQSRPVIPRSFSPTSI